MLFISLLLSDSNAKLASPDVLNERRNSNDLGYFSGTKAPRKGKIAQMADAVYEARGKIRCTDGVSIRASALSGAACRTVLDASRKRQKGRGGARE